MKGRINAPFTAEQVDALNAYQRASYAHPFTCAGHDTGDRTLFATRDGWICPHCNYRQRWASDGMLQLPPDPVAELQRQAAEAPITEEWLKDAGFKWHQLDRQPDKHWLLWIGGALKDSHGLTSYEDLGVELAPAWWKNRNEEDVGNIGSWHCWLRSDAAGRYHRFIHIRPMRAAGDVVGLIEAMTGQAWDIQNHMYGSVYRPEAAARLRKEHQRLDRELTLGASPHSKWYGVEKDDSRGRALPEHLEAHADQQGEKEKP